MKRIIKITVSLVILMMVAGTIASGQEYIKLERSKAYELDKVSGKIEFIQKVNEEFNYLRIKTEGKFSRGNILIELIDPSGKLERNFTIEAGNKGVENTRPDRMGAVSGQMQKAFRNPSEGEWLVRISPDEASGSLKIYCIMIFNPRTDLIELEQIEKDTDEHLR